MNMPEDTNPVDPASVYAAAPVKRTRKPRGDVVQDSIDAATAPVGDVRARAVFAAHDFVSNYRAQWDAFHGGPEAGQAYLDAL